MKYLKSMKDILKLYKKIISYLLRKSIYIFNVIKNFNNKHYCPVCNSKIFFFIPLPDQFKNIIYIQNQKFSFSDAETLNHKAYTCSNCGASDRERLYSLFFEKFIFPFYNIKDMHLIHFAPENALRKFIEKLPFRLYRTADLMMKNVDDHVDLTKLDIYQTNSFDFFICSHMLEHIVDDKKAVSELFRILKPNGKGILMVPILVGLENTYEDNTIISEEDRLKHFGQEDHVRAYARADYIKLLSDSGFKVKEYTVNDFTKEEFLMTGIDIKSVLYIVEKHDVNKDKS